MFRWRAIASYDEVQAARRRIWGETEPDRGSEPVDPIGPSAMPFSVALLVGGYGHTSMEPLLAPGGGAPLKGPMPGRKTEKPSGERHQTKMGRDRPDRHDDTEDGMAKYLSREWVEAGRAHVEKDDRLASLTRGVRASVLCVVHDVPDHADEVFYIAFDDGRIVDLYSGDKHIFDQLGKVPSFEVHGDYATYMRIQEGHLTQTTAVMRGMLRLKGSWLKALRYIRALEGLTTILREVPTEY